MSEAVATELPEKECDLVMKGGITSGVVYPRAITTIADHYRFRNLGGASAGAIAAVAAAACEYRRNTGVVDAYKRLEEVGEEIKQEGFVQSLFQPTKEARPAFKLALELVTSKGSRLARLAKAVRSILRIDKRFLLGAALAVLIWGTIVGLTIWGLLAGASGTLEIVATVLIALAALPVAALLVSALAIAAVLRFVTRLDRALKSTWFGMCTGRTEEGQTPDSGLTDWLSKTIQHCAGLPENEPLTFRMLRGDDERDPRVNLQLITTDLSASRPATLPLPEPADEEPAPYLFDLEDWKRLFPQPVVEHMVEVSKAGVRKHPVTGRDLYPIPGLDLPIVVAARLSLSFPILLATVPFWRADGPPNPETGEPSFVQHIMSDGGICSNFPIHYFDSLFPSRPTFGLDLQPWRLKTDKRVEMSDAPRWPQFSRVGNVPRFFTQILNAARNWRDNMQAELPGYRDRVCQIRLSEEEGGLNLNMPAPVVERLIGFGKDAGAEVTNPSVFDWDRHRITRFKTMMYMLQQSFGEAGFRRPGVYAGEHPGRSAFRTVVERWQEEGKAPEPPPLDWWGPAIGAGNAVFDLAAEWPDFEADPPRPPPVLRIIPRV
jgi:Patatin-like phospholipase